VLRHVAESLFTFADAPSEHYDPGKQSQRNRQPNELGWKDVREADTHWLVSVPSAPAAARNIVRQRTLDPAQSNRCLSAILRPEPAFRRQTLQQTIPPRHSHD
jgi:hypothetical protein